MNEEQIQKVDDNSISVIPPQPEAIVFTKEVIDGEWQKAQDKIAYHTKAIEDIKIDSSIWFDRQAKAEELGIKTKQEIKNDEIIASDVVTSENSIEEAPVEEVVAPVGEETRPPSTPDEA